MSTVKAEMLAVDSLRAHLLLKLPAKVTSINSERAAVLKAPRAGPYTVVGDLRIGTAKGTYTTVALTTGSRTATQVAAEIAVAGLTASVDAQDRLVLTSSSAPVAGTPSVVALGSNAGEAAANEAFAWDAGGESVVRAALVAPSNPGVRDGDDGLIDVRQGFAVVLGKRRTAPRSPNIRDDCHIVTVDAEVVAAEPNGDMTAAHEFMQQAVRAVREVLLEDRTLGGTVHLTQLPAIQYEARTFRIAGDNFSPLYSSAPLQVAVHVFERN